MTRLLPRRRRWRVLLGIAAVLFVYLLALSLVPRLFGEGDTSADDRRRALRAVEATEWGLVLPEDRAALGHAVDRAWRSLSAYSSRYVTGRPEDLAAGRPEGETLSTFRLDGKGIVLAQRDSTHIAASNPASGGREEQQEGFRIRTDKPYVNSKGRRVSDAEQIYQRGATGGWTCERVPSDRVLPPAPRIDFTDAGDSGISQIDGIPVRAFVLTSGAFGLQGAATIWLETGTLRIRRMETASVIRGRREVWSYDSFNQPREITPPQGVPCTDT